MSPEELYGLLRTISRQFERSGRDLEAEIFRLAATVSLSLAGEPDGPKGVELVQIW